MSKEEFIKQVEENQSSQPKYYTPEIEEFHEGFEFEYKYNDNRGWTPKVYDSTYGFDKVEASDYSRVKQLDREDIESLGWRQEEDIDPNNDFDVFRKGEYKLSASIGPEESLIVVEHLWNDGEHAGESTLFDGYVKNKSELKRILKQIGV